MINVGSLITGMSWCDIVIYVDNAAIKVVFVDAFNNVSVETIGQCALRHMREAGDWHVFDTHEENK